MAKTNRLYYQTSYSDFNSCLQEGAILSEFEKLKSYVVRTGKSPNVLERYKAMYESRRVQGTLSEHDYASNFSVRLSNLKLNGHVDISHVIDGPQSTYEQRGELVMLGFDVPQNMAPDSYFVQLPKLSLEHLVVIWAQPLRRQQVLRDLVIENCGKYCDVPVYDFVGA